MLQSILLVTPNSKLSLHHHFHIDLSHTNLDTLTLLSDKSIGIDEVKNAKQFAASPPIMSSTKRILIPQANQLTPEAQNALLKLLEEPPTYLQIILALTNPHQLLDTIISRCQIITDSEPQTSISASDILTPLLIQDPQGRLASLPPTTTKEAALEFCHQLISSARKILLQNPSNSTSTNLETLLECQSRLIQNTNPTLTLTDAVLSLLPLPIDPATMSRL